MEKNESAKTFLKKFSFPKTFIIVCFGSIQRSVLKVATVWSKVVSSWRVLRRICPWPRYCQKHLYGDTQSKCFFNLLACNIDIVKTNLFCQIRFSLRGYIPCPMYRGNQYKLYIYAKFGADVGNIIYWKFHFLSDPILQSYVRSLNLQSRWQVETMHASTQRAQWPFTR